MKVKKVLLATDFSHLAKNAFQYALNLCAQTGAELTVMNVYRTDFGVPVPETLAYDMLEARKKHALNLLESFVQATNDAEKDLLAQVKLDTRLEMGLAVDAILDISEEGDYSLVVMGTKGEHNLAENIFGSITSLVIKQSKVPVLVVPEGCTYPEQGLQTLAFATDLSAGSLDFIHYVADWAEQVQAQLHCVHVNTVKANDYLQAAPWEELRETRGILSHNIEDSSVSHGLDVFVKENQVNLLMLLQHKRSWWENLLHSSHTKHIALNSIVPLLILHEK